MDKVLSASVASQLSALKQLAQDGVKAARNAVKGIGQDGKYFSSSKKGEVSELRAELASPDLDVMKDAVKKVIAAITVGKDMSALFPDVVNCMRTDNVEVKKLVYLYLINYAKSNPDLTIMAVNSFVKDSEHASPLIRALAIRTMGCIRVERIVEYLAPPLKRALSDEDPYVRKTAALCVAKLVDIAPAIVKSQGFLDSLRDLLSDGNPTVVANAVAALTEVQEATGKEVFEITPQVLQKLLAAVNECTEWGQVFILDSLARYRPADAREAETIVERVSPRLVHQNPAVVLSAVKILMIYLDLLSDAELVNAMCRKLAPPLITLAQASQPEVQYVALRNISLVVQKRPHLLSHKIKVFFAKYNDPIYVKMEKLDILIRLANDRNVDQVLLELKEYASEVDVEYVRRAVRTIGRLAIKLEVAAEKCIKVLLQLIATKVNYVVQEAVVVIKDIFRRYPNRYESIIGVLCGALETLDEPDAKAAMIWIVGEYSDRIDNAPDLLGSFMDTFHDETTGVQLQLLTATVKLFLRRPADSEALVQRVLSAATEASDNPDLRDRGYIYWRLLTADPDAAKAVVLAERPVIQDDASSLEPSLLDLLSRHLSTLASVYHKPPEAFVRRARPAGVFEEEGEEDDGGYDEDGGYGGYDDGETAGGGAAGGATGGAGVISGTDDDLLGLGSALGSVSVSAPVASAPVSSAPVASSAPGGGLDDLFGFGAPAPAPAAAAAPAIPSLPQLGEKDGLVIRGRLSRRNGAPVFEMVVVNGGAGGPIASVALKCNLNPLGLTPAGGVNVPLNPPVAPGAAGYAVVPLAASAAAAGPGIGLEAIQAAARDNASGRVVFFTLPLAYAATFSEGAPLDKAEFAASWKSLGPESEAAEVLREVVSTDASAVKTALAAGNVAFVASRPGPDPALSMHYFAAAGADTATPGGTVPALIELTFKTGLPAIKAVVKASNGDANIARLALGGVKALLKP